ncbi:MAG: FecR domain-containing protein [Lachnospiraceae bacterium]|nr:FecR domain-containing protein [Lachnospiraceae bacterium]
MQKLMSNKKGIICICAVAVVIVAAVAVLLSGNKGESYRSILVYEIEGSAVIDRADVGSMNAAENLYLESGDHVSVAQDSSMRMKLDDDKYVMAEADTIFSVEAEGTDVNSRTKICLEQGAITNEIQHPLSEGASYETSTPNSVMAVRGTIYRVELYTDDNGEQNTKMCCFQGKVETTPILPDGTSGEAVLVPAGSELTIHSDGTVDDVRDIVYEELSEQAIQNLVSMLENGQTMEGITLEEMNGLLDQTVDEIEISESSEPEQTRSADAEENFKQDDADADTATDVAENVSEQTGKNVKVSVTRQTTAQPEQKVPAQDTAQPEVSKPAIGSSVDNNAAVADNSQGENTGSDSVNSEEQNNSESNDDGSDDEKSDKKPSEKPAQTVTYTVTFEYQGTTFATQKVKSGKKASAPLLVPAQNGAWDFDFDTVIKKNTKIVWKE